MLTHSAREIYHKYFYAQILEGNEPLSFNEWYAQVFEPYLTGLTVQLMAKN